MREEEIRKAFDAITLADEKKRQIYDSICEADSREKGRSAHPIWKGLATAAAIFLALGITAMGGVYLGMTVMGADAAADGGFHPIESISEAGQFIKGLFGLNTDTPEVVQQAKEDIFRDIIYAPDVLWLDDQRLIFSTGRALFIYDRETPDALQTIDMQEMDCIYWNVYGDGIRTHALYEEGEIWLFNEKNGIRYGKFYHYNLSDAQTPSEESEDDSLWEELYEKWQNRESQYVDTFHTFEEIGLGIEHVHPNDQGVYSERSLRCVNADGTTYLAYLTVPTGDKGIPSEKKYVLNLYHENTGQTTAEELLFADYGTEIASESLPEFVYTGDDQVLKALCEYILQHEYYIPEGCVCIPAFVVFDEIERDDSLYVFGNFWKFSYYQNGNTLENATGGEYPARFQMKKNDIGEYEITEVLVTGDGSEYVKGIRDFTQGFDGVYEKYFSAQTDEGKDTRREARKEFIRMYEEQNHLGIEYYKDFGWEPVAIYE